MNPPDPSTPVVEAQSLARTYRRGSEEVHALRWVSFRIQPGEFVALLGPSGAGKSTLLNLVGCMDSPTAGQLRLAGRAVEGLGDAERTKVRRHQIGFVFQHFGLVPTLTVEENVTLPTLFAGGANAAPVGELLERVGLSTRRRHRPHELSGGEMQRVAIARALVNRPALLIADEPTGNLDSVTGDSIIALFRELNSAGLTILAATHNAALAAAAGRQLVIQDGQLVAG